MAANLYPATCEELLEKWDRGEVVHTIEMGGMGPGYEQALQITAFEMLRYMLTNPIDWEEVEKDKADERPYELRYWKKYRDEMDKTLFAEGSPVKDLGLSGAQYGAASSLASALARRGPGSVMAEPQVADRHIMVSNKFPA